MNNPDNISESLEKIFWVKILKFFDVRDGKIWIRDRKNSDPGTTQICNTALSSLLPNACLYLDCVAVRASTSGAEERRGGRPRALRS